MTFKINKYQVIKKAVPYELANFIFNYFMLKREAVSWMYNNNIIYDTGMFGTWKDRQVPNTYSHYADMVTYSYARIYKNGDILKRHKDRPSCEISTTLNLGGDLWPIFIDGTGSNNVIDEHKNIHKPNAPKGTKITLDVGDMLVYSGCELEHWREPFEGNVCGQVFLHYNHIDGQFASKNIFDGRPMLGVPKMNFG
jgi:hypothetical protein